MRVTQRMGTQVFFAGLVCVFLLGTLGTWAMGQTQPITPVPMGDNSQAATTTPGQIPENFFEPGQLVPSYNCSPAKACELRACPVGPSGMYWFSADYLLWWTQGPRVVPLVTTSNDQDGGVIGQPSTEILFGNERLGGDSRSGFAIKFGRWFHCGRTSGVEFDYFNLGERGTNFNFTSSAVGVPLYARPFYDVNPDHIGENAQQMSNSTFLRGTVEGRIDENFQSAGVNVRLNLCCNMPCEPSCCEETCDTCCGDTCGGGCGTSRADEYCRRLRGMVGRVRNSCYRVEFIAGYRYYQLTDSLRIHEDLEYFEGHGQTAAGSTIDVTDEFRSRNDFHGGELGLVTEFYHGRWSLELLAKMALGNNNRTVTISGQTTNQSPGDVPVTYVGGIMALEDANIGRYTSDQFVVIPQFGAEIGYQLTCRLRAHVGYDLILWNNVARASEQIDYTLNSSYFPPADPSGEVRPEFSWRDTDFWAQGMNFGLEYRF